MPDLQGVVELVKSRLPRLMVGSSQHGISIFFGETEIAWQRPLSKKDMLALGDKAPRGDVLAIHVDSVATKQAWISSAPESCFDSAHFANYAAVLIDLERCDLQVVFELLSEHLD